ncbi:hypothetical protein BN2476_350261 [Paraburkholderia piptadeniae]|uniref:HTH cro/C1-type domain-containing protein n=1 Tax=Paraburkholderia piptadeniae TaxID=1701573 RepID=A0A1N7S8I7_9BURK|nr:helix-turn-helix domain-containing protein [Paraburkholderia piptadeniae]SIT43729.1 hypothetical protein BN2476_350261 [Paraburkholderia piptadeniae]
MVQRLLAGGHTQRSIADRLGCSQPTISDIANGKIGKKRPAYQLVRGLEQLVNELPPVQTEEGV